MAKVGIVERENLWRIIAKAIAMQERVRVIPDLKIFSEIIYNAFEGESNMLDYEPWLVCLPWIVQNYIGNVENIKFEDF